jgi:hypothetical protein
VSFEGAFELLDFIPISECFFGFIHDFKELLKITHQAWQKIVRLPVSIQHTQ